MAAGRCRCGAGGDPGIPAMTVAAAAGHGTEGPEKG